MNASKALAGVMGTPLILIASPSRALPRLYYWLRSIDFKIFIYNTRGRKKFEMSHRYYI